MSYIVKKIFLIVFAAAISTFASAQLNDQLYKQAIQLKNNYKLSESLLIFQMLLKSDSNKVEYLYNASFLYSRLGNLFKHEADTQKYFHEAEYLSKKAI